MPFWSSSPAEFKQVPSQYNQQQQGGFMQALQMALSQLQNPQQGFEPIAQQARSQFETQTLPSLVEQFTAGAPSGERSSAFAGALGSAGSGLEENLASMGAKYGLQQQGLSQNLLGMGLTPQNQYAYQPGKQSGIMNLLGGLSGGIGSSMGGAMGSVGGGFSGLLNSLYARGLPGKTMF